MEIKNADISSMMKKRLHFLYRMKIRAEVKINWIHAGKIDMIVEN